MTRVPRALSFGVLAFAWLAASLAVYAQTAPPAEALFADAAAKETAVRRALAEPGATPTLLKAVRTVVQNYEALALRYPASPTCDEALWRASRLSADAFHAFGDLRDQGAAERLLRVHGAQYPLSRFARQATAATPLSRPLTRPEPLGLPAKAGAEKLAMITSIRRATLADVVRIVIEMDREVTFHAERIDNPARVFLDMPSTDAARSLRDQTIRFDGDGDLVRQVRIGRHSNDTTRVVLEAADVSSYSVYPLYNPFRLIVDCLREKPLASTTPMPRSLATARRLDPWARLLTDAAPTAVWLRETTSDSSPLAPAPGALAPPAALIVPAPPAIGGPSRNLGGGLSIARQLGLGVSRVVIDPGHGGHDPGTKAGGTTEAEFVLDVALRLEALFLKAPGVNVVLTRRTDDYVPLQERTALANRETADLFLSIHANASSLATARGIETYFLNFATNLSSAAVAARENGASGQGMAELPDVVRTIALNNKLDESKELATYVQRALVAKLRPFNRSVRDLGVKQAPFAVLIGAAMPSVLTEVAFMTNDQEARLLKSSVYRQKIAEALFDGVRRYQSSLKAVRMAQRP